MKTITISLESDPAFIENLLKLIAAERKKLAKILLKESHNKCFIGSYAQSCGKYYNSYGMLMHELSKKAQEAQDNRLSTKQTKKDSKKIYKPIAEANYYIPLLGCNNSYPFLFNLPTNL